MHNWQLKTALFEVRKIGGQKIINPMVLSVVTFWSKIALNAEVSKSTATYRGCLGALKKKQPAEKMTNRGNTLYDSSVPSWHAWSASLCLGDNRKFLFYCVRIFLGWQED